MDGVSRRRIDPTPAEKVGMEGPSASLSLWKRPLTGPSSALRSVEVALSPHAGERYAPRRPQFAARAPAMSACFVVVPWPPAMMAPGMPYFRNASPPDTVASELSIVPPAAITL